MATLENEKYAENYVANIVLLLQYYIKKTGNTKFLGDKTKSLGDITTYYDFIDSARSGGGDALAASSVGMAAAAEMDGGKDKAKAAAPKPPPKPPKDKAGEIDAKKIPDDIRK